jgi:N-acylneuraminate cytidylyltransferase
LINGHQVIAIIPARGGSKGVPRKNVRLAGGKPLIAWTIESARASKYIDRIVVSTEDEEIAAVSRQYSAEVLDRPTHLAQDDTPGIDVVIHALDQFDGYPYVVLLQPTSPFRSVEDIDGCIEQCLNQGAPACVSICESHISPYWMYTLDEQMLLKPFIQSDQFYSRRQDAPKVYQLNGAVYVAKTDWLQLTRSFLTHETLSYIMPQDRSLDIDTTIDFEFADFLLLQKRELP